MELKFCYFISDIAHTDHIQTRVKGNDPHSLAYIYSMVEMNPDVIFFYLTQTTDIWPHEASEVGKYDALWVCEQADGYRWDAARGIWVHPDSGDFTSWLTEELGEWIASGNRVPISSKWVNINEP